jgi:hypothetical protein
MPGDNSTNTSQPALDPTASPSAPELSPASGTATGAIPSASAHAPASSLPSPPAPPAPVPPASQPPPNPPPPPPEPEKDWTTEDPAKDTAKAPVFQNDPAYWADPAFFRLVILFAGWVLVLSVGGMLLLAANDKEIPQGIVAAASGLVGLLTGIFAAKSSKA